MVKESYLTEMVSQDVILQDLFTQVSITGLAEGQNSLSKHYTFRDFKTGNLFHNFNSIFLFFN